MVLKFQWRLAAASTSGLAVLLQHVTLYIKDFQCCREERLLLIWGREGSFVRWS